MKSAVTKYGVQFALIATAAVWGATFVVVDDAISKYPMFGFLFWRFAAAAVLFIVLFPHTIKRMNWENVRFGIGAGILLSLGYIFQTWALNGENATTAARCAFITGLYVVLVPFVQALIMRKRPQTSTSFGIVISVAGLLVLSGILSGGSAGWVKGDSLAVICALAYTAHMLFLGLRGRQMDTMVVTWIQLVVTALICGSISFVVERPGLPRDPSVIAAIVICAVFASALGNFIQTWAQKRISPSRVALILVTEPAFGGIFGWVYMRAFPLLEVLGATLMLGGMVISEITALKKESGVVELEEAIEGIPVFDEVEQGNKS